MSKYLTVFIHKIQPFKTWNWMRFFHGYKSITVTSCGFFLPAKIS